MLNIRNEQIKMNQRMDNILESLKDIHSVGGFNIISSLSLLDIGTHNVKLPKNNKQLIASIKLHIGVLDFDSLLLDISKNRLFVDEIHIIYVGLLNVLEKEKIYDYVGQDIVGNKIKLIVHKMDFQLFFKNIDKIKT